MREIEQKDIVTLLREVNQLKQQQAELLTTLRDLVTVWRVTAAGHYCQTYNAGMGQGYEQAAALLKEILERVK